MVNFVNKITITCLYPYETSLFRNVMMSGKTFVPMGLKNPLQTTHSISGIYCSVAGVTYYYGIIPLQPTEEQASFGGQQCPQNQDIHETPKQQPYVSQ